MPTVIGTSFDFPERIALLGANVNFINFRLDPARPMGYRFYGIVELTILRVDNVEFAYDTKAIWDSNVCWRSNELLPLNGQFEQFAIKTYFQLAGWNWVLDYG